VSSATYTPKAGDLLLCRSYEQQDLLVVVKVSRTSSPTALRLRVAHVLRWKFSEVQGEAVTALDRATVSHNITWRDGERSAYVADYQRRYERPSDHELHAWALKELAFRAMTRLAKGRDRGRPARVLRAPRQPPSAMLVHDLRRPTARVRQVRARLGEMS